MALIECPECGKEISDKAIQCPNCGYPIEHSINPKFKTNKKKILLFVSIATAFVIVLCISIKVAQYHKYANNPFKIYTDVVGKTFDQIPDEATKSRVIDNFIDAELDTGEIWGIPGKVHFMSFTGEPDETLNWISWYSDANNRLTNDEIENFLHNMEEIYGKWNEEEMKEDEGDSDFKTLHYIWERSGDYYIDMGIAGDNSEISVIWCDARLLDE